MKRTGQSKQLKRILTAAVLAVVTLLILSSLTFAGGWHKIGPNEQPGGTNVDNPDAGLWKDNVTPHRNLQTSTNNCKTCHSVHEAEVGENGTSFKLLRDKTRVTECNSCHDATSSLSDLRPYKLGEPSGGKKVRGEHSLGSSVTPDADEDLISTSIKNDGLSCSSCHSVHGASIMQGSLVDDEWEDKILKKDPAGNGGDAGASTAYTGGNINGGFTVNSTNSNSGNGYAGSKTAFCADCHNQNSNWDENLDGEPGNEYGRPNSTSHVQGPAAEGLMTVNGQKVRVANYRKSGDQEHEEVTNAGRSGWRLKQSTAMGCLSCHQANNDGENSAFPHQSAGSKLLIDNYTSGETIAGQAEDAGWINERVAEGKAKGIMQSKRGTNQAERSLASLDKVCLDCHRDQRGLGADTLGAGKNY